jgi:hypothetical protein
MTWFTRNLSYEEFGTMTGVAVAFKTTIWKFDLCTQ